MNIKAAKDRITALGLIVDWQKKAYPERYNQTLEEQLDMWKALLHKHKDTWWELNFLTKQEECRKRSPVVFSSQKFLTGELQMGAVQTTTSTRTTTTSEFFRPTRGPKVELEVLTKIPEQLPLLKLFH